MALAGTASLWPLLGMTLRLESLLVGVIGLNREMRDEMVEAQLVACRLEVNSDIIGEVEPLPTAGYFRAVLQPSMDETNRRQFRGCLEDWKIDQFQLDVIRLAEIESNG
jgi:hypothetical protein